MTCNIEELHEIQAQERATASQIVVAMLGPGLWWPLKALRSDELMFLEALWF